MKFNMKKLLLIGGSGGIGSELIKIIDRQKYEVFSTNSKNYDVTGVWGFPSHKYSDMDIVVNLSGKIQNSLLSVSNMHSRLTIEANCYGAVNILKDFLPHMIERKYGRIIMMSSIFSEINVVEMGVYSATKAFVDKLVKIAAIENAQHGITINSIQLGYTEFGMGLKTTPENIDKARNKSALKRFCTIQELYNTIEYIINTEYLTGENIKLGGGLK